MLMCLVDVVKVRVAHNKRFVTIVRNMEFNPEIFKAYDIRGLVGKDFDLEFVETLGRAFVTLTGAKVVVAGRDMRSTSPEYFAALSKGMMKQGADVIDIGMVSTPMFYFAVENYELHEAGIMVTASHNPSEYNGFKMTKDHPSKAIGKGAGMEELKALVEKGEFPESKEGTLVETDIVEDYLDKVFSFVPPESIRKDLKVVVDAGNGMDGVILPDIFERLGCEVHKLYWEPDGTFPNHEANPLKTETLVDLQKKMKEVGADIGVAFDGDGDRVAFVDEKAEPVRTDLILALLAQIMLPDCEGKTVCYDTRCSDAVREEVEKQGGQVTFTPVGHALIKPIVMKENACFGGELSGHYYFPEFGTAECSDYLMLMMLQLVSERGKLSDIIEPFKKYHHSGEINFEVEDKATKIAEVKEKYMDKATSATEIDGIRINFEDWWLSVRQSNTEPLLRLNLEAKTEELMQEKKQELSDLLGG